MKIEIAVAVSEGGNYRCCGPFDYDEGEHHDSMAAARTWTAEAGEIIVSSWWIKTEIPDPIRAPLTGVAEEAI